jgi:deoxycytidylate deaminase
MRQKHGCVIVRRGSVLAMGYNKRRAHDYYGWLPEDKCSFHAEVVAIRKTKQDLANATIYVARINGSEKERYSAPCPYCKKVIEEAGIRKVIYTIDE